MIDPMTGYDVGRTFVQPHDRIKNTGPHVVPVHATPGNLPGNLTLGSNPPYADDDSQATKHSHASKASTLTFGQNQVYEISKPTSPFNNNNGLVFHSFSNLS